MHQKLNLVLDFGNTALKGAVFNGDQLLEYFHSTLFEAEQALEGINQKYNDAQVIISSVIQLNFHLPFSGNKLILLDQHTPTPVINKYLSPETLGRDRLANACFGATASKGKNCLIMDAGTCLKFDFVNSAGEYLGGSISPGLHMRYEAMHTFTDRLPLLDTQSGNLLIGRNTKESMISGAFLGMKAEMEGFVRSYKEEFGVEEIWLTGGDAPLFADAFNFSIFADPYLTLKGLNAILNYNA